jgi:Domain of unknown function (DUF4397)
MKLLRYLAPRLAAVALLLGSTAVAAGAGSPAASAAPLATQDGWVRIAHLSPEAPAMDMYLYPFGDSAHPTVLKDVAYGDVSAYMTLAPGQYTVAMRGFDASPSSSPALVSSFMVAAKTAYTVAALGPDPGLRVETLQDQMTAPPGKTLVRVLQASLKQDQVAVDYGPTSLAKGLTFSSVTPYAAVPAGQQAVEVTAPGVHTSTQLGLGANTVHTIVVLDSASGMKVDDLTDAVGIKAMPKGGPATGFGGTAPRSPVDLAPWQLLVLAGLLLTAVGVVGFARPRRAAAVRRGTTAA